MTDLGETRFQSRHQARGILITSSVVSLLVLLTTLGGLSENEAGLPDSELLAIGAAVVLVEAVALLWTWRRLVRAGVYVTDDEVRIVNPFATRRVPVTAVDHFSIDVDRLGRGVAKARLTSGEEVRVWGIQARPRFRGGAGPEATMIDALNRRVSQVRASKQRKPS